MLILLVGMTNGVHGYASALADTQPAHCAQHDGSAPSTPSGGDCCQHDMSGCGCLHAVMLTQLPSWRVAAPVTVSPATSSPGVEPVSRISSPFRPPI